jgi:hypothetical protein
MKRQAGTRRFARPVLVPALPRSAWVVLGGDFASAVGSGLTLPFLFVYAHQVHGLVSIARPATFTAIYAADAATSLAFVPVLARLRHPAPLPPPNCSGATIRPA